MDVHTPHSLDEALRLKSELPDARFVQGAPTCWSSSTSTARAHRR